MRGVMRLGGMVASGGPYAIEHPAPSWVWIMPVAIMFGMVCFFLNLFSSRCRRGQPDAAGLAGPFPVAGLEFPGVRLHTRPGGGLAWGWLICGVIFVLMGGLPLLLAFKPTREKIRSRLQNGQGLKPYAVQWLLIAAGVYRGDRLFSAVSP